MFILITLMSYIFISSGIVNFINVLGLEMTNNADPIPKTASRPIRCGSTAQELLSQGGFDLNESDSPLINLSFQLFLYLPGINPYVFTFIKFGLS